MRKRRAMGICDPSCNKANVLVSSRRHDDQRVSKHLGFFPKIVPIVGTQCRELWNGDTDASSTIACRVPVYALHVAESPEVLQGQSCRLSLFITSSTDFNGVL